MIKLYDVNEKSFINNGLGVIQPLKCLEIKKISLNGWYLDIELSSKYANIIKQDMIIFAETKEKGGQPFRIGNISKKNKKISFQAHHVGFDADNYFLLDVRPMNLSPVSFLKWVNDRTDKKSPFYVTSNVKGSSTSYFIRKTLLEAFKTAEEVFGGYFDFDGFNISLLESVGNDDGFSIIYGKNLQGISVLENWSSVVTRLYPVGPNGIMLTEEFIESDIQYDKPYTKTVDFDFETSHEDDNGNTIELTENEIRLELRKKASEYIESHKVPLISYSIASDVNQELRIGDTIHIKHPFVSIKTEVQEYTYNLITKRVEKIVFGNYERDAKKVFNDIKNQIGNNNDKVSEAIDFVKEQTDLINKLNKEGLVYIDENEILILDKLPKEEAKNVWRFGIGGIGFSINGYKGPFSFAFTQDGKFNVDFIKANSITVNHLASDVGSSLDLSSNESIKLITQSQDTIKEEINKSLYTLTIFGNGNVIKDTNDTITLNASLFYKGIDVTEKKDASLFNWKRTSDNPTEDTAWNNAHKGKKSITIGANDVNKFASFYLECDVLVDVITASYMTVIDENDVPKLSLSLDANMSTQQVETNGQLWPQWNPLIITPDIKNGVLQVMLNDPDLTVSYKRIVDGVETDLLSSKEIVENKCLKVTDNVLTSIVKRSIIYKCYATYKGFPINAQISFALIKDGQQGQPGKDGVGTPGKDGTNGADGKTYYQWIVYATDSNGSNLSTDPTNKTYMGIAYQKETLTPSNNPRDYTWVKIQGPQGNDGKDGSSITLKNKSITYQVCDSATAEPTGTWLTSRPTIPAGKYLWIKTVLTFSDNNSVTNYSVEYKPIDGEKGEPGKDGIGKDGVSIGKIINYYLISALSSGITTSTAGWTTTPQNPTSAKPYLWNYEVVQSDKGATLSTSPPCIIGNYANDGKDGNDGITGNGIDDIVEYYALTSNTSTPADTSFSTGTPPTMTVTNRYLWKYEVIKYTNGTSKKTPKKIIGVFGDTGATGPQGIPGADAAIRSATAPSDTNKLWCDTSVTPNELKYYNSATDQWELLNDNSNDIENSKTELRNEFASALEEEANRIALSVKNVITQIGDLNTLVNSIQNQMILTSEYTEFVKTTTQKLEDLVNGKLDSNQVLEWARFDGSTLELGASNSNFMAKLSTNELGFYNNNVKVAYFSNNYLVVEKGIMIGNFGITLEANGSLSIG